MQGRARLTTVGVILHHIHATTLLLLIRQCFPEPCVETLRPFVTSHLRSVKLENEEGVLVHILYTFIMIILQSFVHSVYNPPQVKIFIDSERPMRLKILVIMTPFVPES